MDQKIPCTAPTKNLPYEVALRALKNGAKIRRASWYTPSSFIVMMPALYLPPYNTQGTERKVNDRTAKWIGEDRPLDCQPYIAMYTDECKWQPGWTPGQLDQFIDDWEIVD